MRSEVIIGLVGGLLIGGLFGFFWGQSTRENAASNVETDIDGGVVTVKIDAGNAVRQGWNDLFS